MRVRRFNEYISSEKVFKSDIVKKYVLSLLDRLRHFYFDYDEVKSELGESDSYTVGYPLSVNFFDSTDTKVIINFTVADVSKDLVELRIVWKRWTDDDIVEANKLTEMLFTVLFYDENEEDKEVDMDSLNSFGHGEILFNPKKINRIDYNFYKKIANQYKFDL